jgi:FtsP/CotA-like multicopper oxidase with cupredoxin domain
MHNRRDPQFRVTNPIKTIIGILAVAALLSACTVLDESSEPTSTKGVTRTYYIAAETVLWDYAPSYPTNRTTGAAFTDDEKVFVEGNGKDRIGRIYKKARYIEYTDGSFSTVKERPPEWEHLGLLGPVIFANVGDTIQVVFMNKTADQIVSMHPHGVFYGKESEGAPYDDGTAGPDKDDDAVPPGGSHTYIWKVPERFGPTQWDSKPLIWLYHSHVGRDGLADETRSTNSGLLGPIIISKQGWRGRNGRLKGIDREFITVFTVFDENSSFYLDANIASFAPDADPDDEGFQESNLMHGVNGYVYGNAPGLTMKIGDKVRWYTIALGTEVDLHTPHWHGNTLTWDRRRVDTINLLPATQRALDMEPDNAGTWMFHCHVNDHFDAGMATTYRVEP